MTCDMQIAGALCKLGVQRLVEGRGLCFLFLSQHMILFVNKTGSNTIRNTGGITRGMYGPMAGVTTRTRGAVTSQRP